MRKCAKTGDEEIAEYTRIAYSISHSLCLTWKVLSGYHLYAPCPYDVFEVLEDLEYPNYRKKTFDILKTGIYRVVGHIGWIWDTECNIIIEEYIDGAWKNKHPITIAVDDEGFMFMLDWRGTKPAIIQHELHF